jgi:hypothetical protein
MALAFLLKLFLAAVVALTALYALRNRRRHSRAKQKPRELLISPLSGLVLGGLLNGFRAITNPQNRHRIVEEQKEDEQSGREPRGGHIFHQQLRQIRQGAEVERLTVRSPPTDSRDSGQA